MKKILIALIVLITPCMVFASTQDQKTLKKKMLNELNVIKNTFGVKYAPIDWKMAYAGWDLNNKIIEAKNQITTCDKITVKKFRQIVKGFFNSTLDYHVGVHFYSTASAYIPIRLKSAQGRYFIAWVDKEIYPEISIGDEVLSFNRKSIQEVIEVLKKQEFGNPQSKTDQALAEIFLTQRLGSMGHEIPEGAVNIKFKPIGMPSTVTHQLEWITTPEEITDGPFQTARKAMVVKTKSNNDRYNFFHKKMTASFYAPLQTAQQKRSLLNKKINKNNDDLEKNEDQQDKDDEEIEQSEEENEDVYLGAKKSLLPPLGEVIWRAPDSCPFDAYLYKTPNNKTIAFVRIATYMAETENAKEFAALIRKFEAESDALIIDQMNNPGGFVLYLYGLASMLTPSSLTVPAQQMTSTQEDVFFAILSLKLFDIVDKVEELKDFEFDSDIQGYPPSPHFIESIKNYFKFIISEWNDGRSLTRANYYFGISTLTPHPWGSYSKPILMLVNELDFSGGDFLPAILQDNKRATIMGSTTAGAGGYVLTHSHPNQFGISSYNLTGSIAERLDHTPIENLGVTPDIAYELTVNDLENGYMDYAIAIQKALDDLLSNK